MDLTMIVYDIGSWRCCNFEWYFDEAFVKRV